MESKLHLTNNETSQYQGISPLLEKQGRASANSAPTAVTLTGKSVEENAAPGTVVGTLGVQDPDRKEAFSFILIDDAGGTFAIDGANRLVVADSGTLDFEAAPSLAVIVQVTDKRGASLQQEIRIDLIDVDESDAPPSQAPTDIRLSNDTVVENSTSGTEVGLLTAIDPDGTETFVFTLVDDAGGRFAIDGDRLVVASGSALDFESADSHPVTIEVSDSGGSRYRETISIRILDVLDDPDLPEPPEYVYSGLLPDGGGQTSVRWNVGQPLGTGTTVTFCFLQAVPGYYSQAAAERNAFAPFSAEQRAVALEALRQIASFTGVTFVETDVGDAQITFGTADLPQGSGWAYLPGSGSRLSGDVWIDRSVAANGDLTPGRDGFKTILHEIGHAMGLKHPHEAPALPSTEDSRKFTVMSYSEHPQAAGAEPRTYMTYDIAALQRLYGTGAGGSDDDSYRVGTVDTYVATIWDAHGHDSLDASSAASAVTLDLNPGAFSTVGTVYGWYKARENIAIAYGTVIEDARGGSGGDTLRGNAAANRLDGGAGDDFLTGGGGADVFVFGPGWGNDTVMDFDDGVDRIDLRAAGLAYADVTAGEAAGGLLLTTEAGTILLAGMALATFDATDFTTGFLA